MAEAIANATFLGRGGGEEGGRGGTFVLSFCPMWAFLFELLVIGCLLLVLLSLLLLLLLYAASASSNEILVVAVADCIAIVFHILFLHDLLHASLLRLDRYYLFLFCEVRLEKAQIGARACQCTIFRKNNNNNENREHRKRGRGTETKAQTQYEAAARKGS